MDATDLGENVPILVRNAERLMSAQHYEMALLPLRKALHLDPLNSTVRHYFIRCCLCVGGGGLMNEACEELSLILLQRASQ